ncbi:hypothetical protein HFD91_21095 [Enterobacteriaceae bacterium EKM102V]|uniref:hypothetical protein n=1 Tax=Pantoea TaxID=53335 RepID=UPI00142DA0A1|nr:MULTISPECIES: hypothetical protein [Pantoea]KAF6653080.1 hypothetical protein HFD91_21095 [Enterobacteriaceae bacterium EKM102V]KAF6663493.1 hypothetical protein HFD97_21005 [Pantoea sp. EKM103V]
MSNLTMAKIDADISMLMESLSSKHRLIPSSLKLLKLSLFVPTLALIAAFMSDVIGYVSLFGSQSSLEGYSLYFLSDGWAVVIPTLIIGVIFAFMTYNNLMLYMAVPSEARRNSLILSHLRRISKRTVCVFLLLMLVSTILSVFKSWAALAVPALEFALLFAINMIVGAEINRLGAGLALEKISTLIKKI